jgi:hypothetical protein
MNVPSYEDLGYYLGIYDRLGPRIAGRNGVSRLVDLFLDLESKVGDPYQYKIEKGEQAISILKSTRAFNELNDDNLINDLKVDREVRFEAGKNYVSVDLKMANWQVLKRYDPPFLNELGDTYADFLAKVDVHPALLESKHFRQFVFGHANPKRQVRAQRVIVQELIDLLGGKEGVAFREEHGLSPLVLEFVKFDEAIFSYSDPSDLMQLNMPGRKADFRITPFRVEFVEDFRIHEIWSMPREVMGTREFAMKVVPSHREIVGCSGHRFFMQAKRHILREPLDEPDLYFRMDGHLSIWKVSGMSINLDSENNI